MFKFFTKEYNSINEALKTPLKVKRLAIQPNNNELRISKLKFDEFINLKYLHIHTHPSYDPEIPPKIGSLNALEKLSVLNIPIENFPCWITDLTKLQYLLIRGNEITRINCSFEKLINLKTLRIENCNLIKIPKGLTKLEKLQELSFAITKISCFDIQSLPPNLKKLNLFGIENIKEKEYQNLCKSLSHVNIKIS